MTRQQFLKKSFKGYALIDFKHSNLTEPVECLLCGVNYDTEILTLRPLIPDHPFDKDEFHVHISQCEMGRPKLKLTKTASNSSEHKD
jgi:hypothetical protein